MTKTKRGGILFVGVLQYMCLGLMYSWSKFATGIRQEMGFDHAQITVAYSVCMAMFTTGILMDGVLGRRLSSRRCALMGTCLCAGGYLLTSLVPVSHGQLIYATYGLCVGFGIGLVYNVWLNNIMQWFPDHSGLASGLLLLGMGLSGVTTTPVMAVLAQKLGWRLSFRCIAVLLLCMGSLAGRAIRPAPSDLPAAPPKQQEGHAEMDSRTMLRQPCFWTFALWKLILIGLGQACSGQLAQIFCDIGQPESIQLLAVSCYVTCNGLARLVWGCCCDWIGRTHTMCLVAALTTVGTGLLAFSYAGGGLVPVFAALMIIALCYGGAATLGANYIAAVFGKTHYRQNNGVSAVTCLPVNLGVTAAIGMVRDRAGSYLPFFHIAVPAALLTVAMALASEYLIRRLPQETVKK